LTDATADRLQGALADRYRIKRELGRGGMATVYLAQDLKHDRPVALKVLRPDLAASLGPERFLREIKLAAHLQHPHILPLHDSGEAGGFLYYVMPYVEGESLRERLTREYQLPVDDAVRIGCEAARALDHSHRHGVIHRDLKPENILLSQEGDTLVADFGIGRALGTRTVEERLTDTGIVIGTPAYMSPEQALGESELDARTDVYSLGVVLYEMLAGEPPFTGPSAQAVVARRLLEVPPPLSTKRKAVSAELERVVSQALARAPADRPMTAGALAVALEATRNRGGATTVPLVRSIGRRLRRVTARHIGVALAALAGIVGLSMFLRDRSRGGPRLDSQLVAVAPFDVLSPSLALWREGLVDLLSRNLDGAASLRTVSPTTVIRVWGGRADPASAQALAAHTGAGLAVFGTLIGLGRDSVQLRATLLDAAGHRVVDQVQVGNAADRMVELADSLTMGLLRVLRRTGAAGAMRADPLSSRSLPALKAFLHGEQHYRLSDWDSAIGFYNRALELDTGFTLAINRLGEVLSWRYGEGDSAATSHRLRAGARNHGLAPRESLLVAADSLTAALAVAPADSVSWSRRRRAMTILEEMTTRYPGDAPAWYRLAEVRLHYGRGPGISRTEREILRTFDRAIALDSSFTPAYVHPIELSLALEGPNLARRYLRAYLALNPLGYDVTAFRVLQRLLDSTTLAMTTLDRALDSLSADQLWTLFESTVRWRRQPGIGVEVARRLNKLDPEARTMRIALASRGRLRECLRERDGFKACLGLAALAGIVREDSARVEFERFVSQGPGTIGGAQPWLAVQGDTASLIGLARVSDSWLKAPDTSPRGRFFSRIFALTTPAFLALARRDTAAAIRAFENYPDTLCALCFTEPYAKAALLSARHRDQEAAALLDRIIPLYNVLDQYSVPALLERGRIAERQGDPARALEAYRAVSDMWRDADPELQPFVAEARAGLSRLEAESGS
jgi:eukaryotic-like serine/threonine-protein kinase